MTKDEALKQALEALEDAAYCVQKNYCPDKLGHDWDDTIASIKEALAQPECARCKDLEEQAYDLLGQLKVANLKWSVAHPWVGLTELERAEICDLKWWDWEDSFDIDGFARAIEAKLKEKNT